MYIENNNCNRTPILWMGNFCDNNLYIKREDLLPFCFGGNKARKAMKFFEEIDNGNYDCVVTYGSGSSNHCRVVANMAAIRKIPCHIISPEEASEPTYNSKMMELFNANTTVVSVEKVSGTIENKMEELRNKGMTPYFIQGGGHGNLGTQAYRECYEEICAYEIGNKVNFDYIFLASGTGTTQAGLVCGQLVQDDKRNIVGISIARKNPRGRNVVLESIKEYLTAYQIDIEDESISSATIFVDDYVGTGYAGYNETITTAVGAALRTYGIPMDSTYVAKAYNGMQNYIKKEQIHGKNILFIHTGGTPLFFDDLREKL